MVRIIESLLIGIGIPTVIIGIIIGLCRLFRDEEADRYDGI